MILKAICCVMLVQGFNPYYPPPDMDMPIIPPGGYRYSPRGDMPVPGRDPNYLMREFHNYGGGPRPTCLHRFPNGQIIRIPCY